MQRNVGRQDTYRVALSHTVKKLVRVLFTLQTKNLVNDPDSLRLYLTDIFNSLEIFKKFLTFYS